MPCILVSETYKHAKLHDGILADVAPTLLTMAGMAISADMTGKCRRTDLDAADEHGRYRRNSKCL